jgi:hypothetical protein
MENYFRTDEIFQHIKQTVDGFQRVIYFHLRLISFNNIGHHFSSVAVVHVVDPFHVINTQTFSLAHNVLIATILWNNRYFSIL